MSTIKDVAARAEVSIKTVSRVINHESGVAVATRERVERAIRDLNYVPNLSAQRLKRGKSDLLALILPRVKSPYAIKLFSSFLAEARKRQYSILVLENDPDMVQGTRFIKRAIMHHRVDGLIFAPPGSDNTELITYVRQQHVPYVAITPNHLDAKQLSVEPTNRQGALEATRYLIGLGHKRIAHITCLPSERFSQDRLAGYCAALEEAGLPILDELIYPGNNSVESGHGAAIELLELPQMPTAIFAGNDEMAVGVIMAALHMGIKVPDDVSVLGFDDAPIGQQVYPRLTTVAQPIEEIARISLEKLVALIEGHNTKIMEQIQVPTCLVVRRSCTTALR